MKSYKIASIAGDGIGKEVLPESLKVLKETAKNTNLKFNLMSLNLLHVITIKIWKCFLMIGKKNWIS